MQQSTLKASILIWSVFMSTIIAIAFISISTKINKEIKNHGDILSNLTSENQVVHMLYEGKKGSSLQNSTLENKDFVQFASKRYMNYGLKKDESIDFSFLKNSNISLKMNNTGALFINIIGTNSQSGVITASKNLQNVDGTIHIKNLGGYLSFTIESNNDFISPIQTYQIVKQFGNTQIMKERGEIKNF